MIAIIDYGMGNLRSVQKAFERLGAEARVTSDPGEIARADKVVFPGVGAFGAAVQELEKRNLTGATRDAIAGGKPFLGICLGLQLLFTESFEDGSWKGLDIIRGTCVRFEAMRDQNGGKLKIPHMGWSRITVVNDNPLLAGIESGDYFYFVHSYYVAPDEEGVTALACSHGVEFTAMARKGNVFATQFHPEKSQEKGLMILENFCRL